MVRPFALIFLLVTATVGLAQKEFSQLRSEVYHQALKDNLEKLQFDWSLPPSYEAAMNDGISLLSKGDWKSALNSFNKIIQYDSSCRPAGYYWFQCYRFGGKKPPGLRRVRPTDTSEWRKAYNRAYIFGYNNLWDSYLPKEHHSRKFAGPTAIAPPFYYLSTYLIQHLDGVDTATARTIQRASSALFAARLDDAIRMANAALQETPSASALYLKAVALQMNSDYAASTDVYRQVLDKDESIIEAHENLALNNYERDKAETAKHLAAINSLDPDNPDAWRFSGLLKFAIRDYPGVIIDLNKYLKVDPDHFDCLKALAMAETQTGNYHESIRDITRAMKMRQGKNDLELVLFLSENYFQLGDYENFIAVLRKAEREFMGIPPFEAFWADKLVELGRTRQAEVHLNHLREYRSTQEYLHQANLIECEMHLKSKPEKALERVNSFIAEEGEQNDYLFIRARTYLALGDKEKAKVDLEKLITSGYEPAKELYKEL